MSDATEKYEDWDSAMADVRSKVEIEDPVENWLTETIDESDLIRWKSTLVSLNNSSGQYNHIQIQHCEELLGIYNGIEERLSQKANHYEIKGINQISSTGVLFSALIRGLQDYYDIGGKMNQVKMDVLQKKDHLRKSPSKFFVVNTDNRSLQVSNDFLEFNSELQGENQLIEDKSEAMFIEDGKISAIARIGDISSSQQSTSGTERDTVELLSYMHLPTPILGPQNHDNLGGESGNSKAINEIPEEDYKALVSHVPELKVGFERAFKVAKEPDRTHIYKQAIAHLIAGKNIVFYGPPGSGKTRISTRLTDAFCAETRLETANAEWTRYDIIGGPAPEKDGDGFEDEAGLFTTAAKKCATSLGESRRPVWLIIDELNRANLDQAFGEVFTQLDLAYRTSENTLPIDDVTVPLAFRLLATMNTSDQAQLFSLGYAFRRRFAFIHVPSLLQSENYDHPGTPDFKEISLKTGDLHKDRIREIVAEGVKNHYERTSAITADTPLSLPQFEESLQSDETKPTLPTLDYALNQDHLQSETVDFLDVLIYVSWKAGDLGLVDIGQGLIIDATKYVVARATLEDNPSWHIVDEAIRSYLLPQFDSVMPELRKSEVTAQNGDIEADLDTFIEKLRQLQVVKSAEALDTAKDTKNII